MEHPPFVKGRRDRGAPQLTELWGQEEGRASGVAPPLTGCMSSSVVHKFHFFPLRTLGTMYFAFPGSQDSCEGSTMGCVGKLVDTYYALDKQQESVYWFTTAILDQMVNFPNPSLHSPSACTVSSDQLSMWPRQMYWVPIVKHSEAEIYAREVPIPPKMLPQSE